MYGWELSDCYNSEVKVYIDDIEFEGVVRTDRPDVLIVYEGYYGGDDTNDKVGWEIEIDLSKLEKGLHQIKVVSTTDDGLLIYKKESSVNLI